MMSHVQYRHHRRRHRQIVLHTIMQPVIAVKTLLVVLLFLTSINVVPPERLCSIRITVIVPKTITCAGETTETMPINGPKQDNNLWLREKVRRIDSIASYTKLDQMDVVNSKCPHMGWIQYQIRDNLC